MGTAIDLGPMTAEVVGYPGDDLSVSVVLVDFTSGPVTHTGATVVATVGAEDMTVTAVEDGLATLALTDSHQPGGGDPHVRLPAHPFRGEHADVHLRVGAVAAGRVAVHLDGVAGRDRRQRHRCHRMRS